MKERIKEYTLRRFYSGLTGQMEAQREKILILERDKNQEAARALALQRENESLLSRQRELADWMPATLEMLNRLVDCAVDRLAMMESAKENFGLLLDGINQIQEAITEMQGSIQGVAVKAREMAAQARISAEKCGEGKSALDRSSQAMDSLRGRVAEIGGSLKRVEKISENVNLLALNALIEATNAGSAGKGFAVVAHEVKSLARESAARAEEIKGKTAALEGATGALVSLIQGGGGTGLGTGAASLVELFAGLAEAAFSASDSGGAIVGATQAQLGKSQNIAGHTARLAETAAKIHEINEDAVREAVAQAAQAREILAAFGKIDKREKTVREIINAAISGHKSWLIIIKGWILDPGTVYEWAKIISPDKCAIAKLKERPEFESVDFNRIDAPGGPHRLLHADVERIVEILEPLKRGAVSGAEAKRLKEEAERLYRRMWFYSGEVVEFLRKLSVIEANRRGARIS